MKKHISPDFIQKILISFNGEWVKYLKGANAHFFEFRSGETSYILRLTEKKHRSDKDIIAEIDWINYLKNTGLNVCYAIPNVNESLLSKWEINEEYYYAVAFKKAEGKRLTFNDYPGGFEKQWGRTLAKMHQAAENYSPIDSRRSEWDSVILLDFVETQLDDPNHEVINQMKAANEVLKKLPKTTTNFGLIHSDLTPGNFMVSDDLEICAYDFDDSQYAHFIYDFNVILFMTLFHKHHQQSTFSVSGFYQKFMTGYTEIRSMDQECLEALPHFLTFFNGLVYVSLQRRKITEDNQPLFNFVSKNLEKGFSTDQYLEDI